MIGLLTFLIWYEVLTVVISSIEIPNRQQHNRTYFFQNFYKCSVLFNLTDSKAKSHTTIQKKTTSTSNGNRVLSIDERSTVESLKAVERILYPCTEVIATLLFSNGSTLLNEVNYGVLYTQMIKASGIQILS